MKEFKCKVAQKGFFAGPVFFVHSVFKNEEEKTTDIQKEIDKLHNAEDSLKKILRNKCTSDKNSDIQNTVLSILEDDVFNEKIEKNIMDFSHIASFAILKASEELIEALGSVDSEYIRSRQEDIRGVADTLISIIEGLNDAPEEFSAICSNEISPAQLSSIDYELIGGMLTDKGSPNSHAAILAGNINIPYLYGNTDAVNEALKAEFIILDSETQSVITDPDDDTKAAALKKMEQIISRRKAEEADEEIPQCRTKVYANIEGPWDVDQLLKSGADGVGLFRTEFLFIGRDTITTEEEQYEAYCTVLKAMGDKDVIIRTMDIGSDKKVSWLNIPNESNPALGLRGVRVSLERKELFNTQLRALLRAGKYKNLKVMFPMIASSWEIDSIKESIQLAAKELDSEGIEYNVPPLGIMIETPAAAVCAKDLAEKIDFFSIGTNDLTQYTLAIDREAQGLDRYFEPHHEAVFKLIDMTVKGGHYHGIETGVCGQLAADSDAIERLISLGVDELSVPVKKVRQTKILAAKAEERLSETDCCNKSGTTASLGAAADGELIPMKEIPDPVFAEGILGNCYGILPSGGNVYSPISGKVISIANTGHAVTIQADDGVQVLVHVGINTVNLGQKAFNHFVKCGERVEKNQLIMEADIQMITDAGLSPMIIVIVLNS